MFKSLILALATAGSVAAAPARSGNLADSAPAPQHKHKRDLTSRGWAGAIQEARPGTWNFVQGTVVLPTLSDGANPRGSGDIWVGIDGNDCDAAILQTGIVCYGDGTFWVWTEWWRHDMRDYDARLGVSGGDAVRMTVNATSRTGGTTTVENLTTGRSVSQTFAGETRYPLCESDAEWIVEDFQEDGRPVPLVDWGTVEFTDTVASGPGTSVSAAGSELINIKLDDGTIVTKSSVDSDGNVFVKYIGN